jgi:hypothetical protein
MISVEFSATLVHDGDCITLFFDDEVPQLPQVNTTVVDIYNNKTGETWESVVSGVEYQIHDCGKTKKWIVRLGETEYSNFANLKIDVKFLQSQGWAVDEEHSSFTIGKDGKKVVT